MSTAVRTHAEAAALAWVGFLFAFAIGLLGVIHGMQEAIGSTASAPGDPPFMDIFMSTVILLAGLGDVRMLVRGISDGRPIAPNLWRMYFGWFIATGSFFLGQQQVFPASCRESPGFLVPVLLPLMLLIFWLIRVRFTNAFQKMSMPRPRDVYSLGSYHHSAGLSSEKETPSHRQLFINT